ncbi:MAG: FAD-binding oxidoreductase [Bdellovibrionaceae bacterium]|nr:FAD-binding oxidoreductase [Pseudobdellovibrionaceae bacterium]
MSINQLKIDPSQIVTDPKELAVYGKDWTTYFDIKCQAVVFPKSHEDVMEIVRWANETKTALVPSGGRTGLSGGACALKNEVVVSFEKFNKIKDFDPIENTIVCDPGVITEEIQQWAEKHGLFYPVDFAARGSSHIGGNIATNAGGIKVLRYGLTRDWVTSLKVVTGAGQSLVLNKSLVKNATGYDLRHLFIGSEGTLGFITECTIQLTRKAQKLQVVLLACESLDTVMDVFAHFNSKLTLTAFEMFSDVALKKVLEQKHLPAPFESNYPFYITCEIELNGSEADETLLNETLESAFAQELVVDGVIAQSDTQAKTFWRYREDISESLSLYSPYKNDISVRVARVSPFVKELDQIILSSYPDWSVVWFGHIGDGNLHLNILRPDGMTKEGFVSECQKVDKKIFECIKKFEGSISAEHGVGLTKKPFLSYSRSPDEIQIFKSIKKIFDPNNIVNPGKVFDL